MTKLLRILAAVLVAQGCSESEPPKRKKVEPFRTPPPKPWTGAAPFDLEIEGKSEQGGITITVTATTHPEVSPPREEVSWTPEPYVLSLPKMPETLVEANVAGSGLTLDLDGDGTTGGVLTLKCLDDGSAEIGGHPISTLESPAAAAAPPPQDVDGIAVLRYDAIPTIGAKGAPVVLYTRCDAEPAVLGFSQPGAPVPVLHVRGPTLQVIVLETVDGPTAPLVHAPAELMINGKPSRAGAGHTLDYEPLWSETPQWSGAYFWMFPLSMEDESHTIQFRLQPLPDPTARRLVLARVNLATTAGERRRLPAVSFPVE